MTSKDIFKEEDLGVILKSIIDVSKVKILSTTKNISFIGTEQGEPLNPSKPFKIKLRYQEVEIEFGCNFNRMPNSIVHKYTEKKWFRTTEKQWARLDGEITYTVLVIVGLGVWQGYDPVRRKHY